MQESVNKKRVFGIVVLHGFETKNFFASGLYEKLSEEYKVVVLRQNFPTKNFIEYIDKYNLDVVELDQQVAKKRLRSEALFLASMRARQRINNVENFNYFKTDRERRISDYILGSRLLHDIFGMRAKVDVSKYYYDNNLEEIYHTQGITDLIIAGYSSPESIALATTAIRNGRNVWLVINSWKDFYVNGLIPFTPTKTFVWSQQMKEQLLLLNSHISSSDVIVSGNPSFDRFFKFKPLRTKAYYGEKYNFNPKRPLILYSMISPKAYEYEKESIELINQKLVVLYPDEIQRPVIVLRRNPIDETFVDETYFSDNNVRYADNYFEGNYENAVFVQLNEGEKEWMDLLYHADINMNVASTVTLEALMMKTPVINIEFDAKGGRNEQLGRYAEAPFYEPLHNRGDVVIAETLTVCMDAIDRFLIHDVIIEDLEAILGSFDGQATRQIIKEINNG